MSALDTWRADDFFARARPPALAASWSPTVFWYSPPMKRAAAGFLLAIFIPGPAGGCARFFWVRMKTKDLRAIPAGLWKFHGGPRRVTSRRSGRFDRARRRSAEHDKVSETHRFSNFRTSKSPRIATQRLPNVGATSLVFDDRCLTRPASPRHGVGRVAGRLQPMNAPRRADLMLFKFLQY